MRVSFGLTVLAAALALTAGAKAHQPYVSLNAGASFANDANLADDNPNSADCVMQPAGAGPCTGSLDNLGNGSVFGVTAGFGFRHGIRTDISYDYRSGFDLYGRDEGGTDFDPPVTSHAFMLNVYIDLPATFTSLDIQPFVGGGVGVARNKMKPLRWSDSGMVGTLPGGTSTDVAWQLTAGASVPIASVKGLHVATSYRYADLGHITKDFGPDLGGPGFSASGNTGAMTGDLTSHEVYVSVIYRFDKIVHIFDRIFR